MPENRLKFTLRRLEKLEPVDKRTKFYDTENKGLVLETFPSGAKFFRTIKRDGSSNRLITVTIGEFPSVTVEMAIKRHCELISEIINGNDPNETKR
ncbi:Arm DNA-binding domain-containing protein, partial [Paraglaciecola sp.]|uniref:Arm DNA-binding domain-containing protein n=1 Tax=Paraglaciecola sp. TaxID=1920173 RepID=UPI0030F497F1